MELVSTKLTGTDGQINQKKLIGKWFHASSILKCASD